MNDLLKFLKRYTDIDTRFIQQFLEIQQGDNTHAPFSIDLELVANWLKTRKRKLKETLVNAYVENIDYIVQEGAREGAPKQGGHNKKKILMTPDTFKMLCMKSKTVDAHKIRYYYVTLEKLVDIYKDDIIKKQHDKIDAASSGAQTSTYAPFPVICKQ